MAALMIDVVFDVVCPWCFVGKRNLEQALDILRTRGVPDEAIAVSYRPFQLNPDLPPEGKDRAPYYREKYKNTPKREEMRGHLEEAGKEHGLYFDFERDCLMPNTLDAHRVVQWAKNSGPKAQGQLIEIMMKAYFEEGQFLGDHGFLASSAAACGLDKALVLDLLKGDQDKERVMADCYEMQRLGVSGVPFYIINRQIGLSGAQPVARMAQALEGLFKQQKEGQLGLKE